VRYYNGQGVEKNTKIAFMWYLKAAEQGHVKAERNVGHCYHDGEGTEQDDEMAKKWLRKAAKDGSDDARDELYNLYREFV